MQSTIQFSLWSLLIGMGAFHGMFLTIVCFTRKRNVVASRYFGFLLLFVAFNMVEYTFAISGLYQYFPHLLSISYPGLFLMGPMYYFYCRRLIDNDFVVSGKHYWHFGPAVVCLLLFLPLYFSSGEEKLSFLHGLASADHVIEVPVGQYIFMITHLIQLFAYVLISKKLLTKTETNLMNSLSDYSTLKLSSLRKMTFVFFCFLLFFLLVLGLLPVVKVYRVELDYMLMFTMSGLIHIVGYTVINQPKFLSEPILLDSENKYSTSRLSDKQIFDLFSKVEAIMVERKLYLKSDFKISNLAEELGMPIHYLSQAINEGAKRNFFEYVNTYRIKHAIRLLRSPEEQNAKILAIAFDAGFSNKTTFNRIFKKHTGYTPSAYRETMP